MKEATEAFQSLSDEKKSKLGLRTIKFYLSAGVLAVAGLAGKVLEGSPVPQEVPEVVGLGAGAYGMLQAINNYRDIRTAIKSQETLNPQAE